MVGVGSEVDVEVGGEFLEWGVDGAMVKRRFGIDRIEYKEEKRKVEAVCQRLT